MLDINLIRTNPELVKENIKKKFQDKKLALVDEVLLLDKKKRELQQEGDNLRAQRNSLAKQIGALMREGKKEEAAKTKEISKKNNERVAAIEAETAEIDVKLKKDMMAIPNIIAADVPVGKDDSENVQGEVFLKAEEKPFEVPAEVKEHCQKIADKKLEAEEKWNELFAAYEKEFPELAAKYKQFMQGYDPDFTDLIDSCVFNAPEATRVSGGKILNELVNYVPNLMSGSADLAPSTKTELKGKGYFTPDNREGHNIHFGIREHAMAAICNGIQLHGGLRVLCSTFFAFSDYMKGGIRMSALMNIPVVYVMTHDSIGVGEDGPTHQPVEQLIALRSIPNIKVFRPCDGKETLAAYISAFTENAPTVLILSRQNLQQNKNSGIHALAGGYILSDCKGKPDVILIGTGSEIDLCTGAKELLESQKIKTRVVSMPCMELFEKQTKEYQEHVLPKSVKARVCVEAASHFAWYKYSRDRSCKRAVCSLRIHKRKRCRKSKTFFGKLQKIIIIRRQNYAAVF